MLKMSLFRHRIEVLSYLRNYDIYGSQLAIEMCAGLCFLLSRSAARLAGFYGNPIRKLMLSENCQFSVPFSSYFPAISVVSESDFIQQNNRKHNKLVWYKPKVGPRCLLYTIINILLPKHTLIQHILNDDCKCIQLSSTSTYLMQMNARNIFD